MHPSGSTNKRACNCHRCGEYLLKGEGIGIYVHLNNSFPHYFCQSCYDIEIEFDKAWESARKDLDEIYKILRDNRVDYIDVDIRIGNLILGAGALVAEVAERIKRKLTSSLVVNYVLIDQTIRDEYTNLRSERDD